LVTLVDSSVSPVCQRSGDNKSLSGSLALAVNDTGSPHVTTCGGLDLHPQLAAAHTKS
jgi:hypothetical protein